MMPQEIFVLAFWKFHKLWTAPSLERVVCFCPKYGLKKCVSGVRFNVNATELEQIDVRVNFRCVFDGTLRAEVVFTGLKVVQIAIFHILS
jgi:hypothetical protein